MCIDFTIAQVLRGRMYEDLSLFYSSNYVKNKMGK